MVGGTRFGRRVVGNGAVVLSIGLMSFGPSILKSTDVAELAFMFWRLLLAIPLYVLIIRATGTRLPGWADLRRSVRGGLAFGAHIVLLIVTFRRTSAANAAIVFALQPVVLLVAGARLFRERPHRSVYGWGAVAFAGVVVTVTTSDASGVATLQGDLLAVLLMLSYAAFMVVSKRVQAEIGPSTYQLAVTIVAAAMVLPVVVAFEGGVDLPSGTDWWLVAAMATLGGSGYLLITVAHGFTSLTMVSLISLGFSVVAPLYAWWLVGEAIGGVQAVGIAVVLAALGIVVTRPVDVVPVEPGREPAGR